jgi:iron complex outermembrane recepter protein
MSNVPSGALAQYDYDGDLANYLPPIEPDPDDPDGSLSAPPDWYLVNYDRNSDAVTNLLHPFRGRESLLPGIERSTIFMDGGFELTDRVSGYAEALLSRRKTTIHGYRQYWQDMLSGTSAIPWPQTGKVSRSSARRRLPITTIPWSRSITPATWSDSRATSDANWNWDVSLQFSRSDGDYHNDRIFNDAIFDEDGFEVNWDASCEGMMTAVRGIPVH